MNWKEVKTQEDIDELFNVYGGFHDSCTVNLRYESGAGVTADRAMHFAEASERELYVIFNVNGSQ